MFDDATGIMRRHSCAMDIYYSATGTGKSEHAIASTSYRVAPDFGARMAHVGTCSDDSAGSPIIRGVYIAHHGRRVVQPAPNTIEIYRLPPNPLHRSAVRRMRGRDRPGFANSPLRGWMVAGGWMGVRVSESTVTGGRLTGPLPEDTQQRA